MYQTHTDMRPLRVSHVRGEGEEGHEEKFVFVSKLRPSESSR